MPLALHHNEERSASRYRPQLEVVTRVRRKWFPFLVITLVTLAAVMGIALYLSGPALRRYVRDRTENFLRVRFKSTVTFDDFSVSLYPQVNVVVTGVRVLHEGRTDVPPLFSIRGVSFTADLLSLLRPRPEIASVRLDGLQINMPPRPPAAPPLIHGTDEDLARKYPLIIHEIRADNALLVILRQPQDDGKPPREFAIQHLLMRNVDFSRPGAFVADLTNAVPKGEIHCVGTFGPWNADDPRITPVSARYTFHDADMSTLKGLLGTLSSEGEFSGPLDYLQVRGTTDVPNFALRISDHPVHLQTNFTAIVDGTNGDVILQDVLATLQHSTLETHGEVVDMDQQMKGRTILLETVSKSARIEDLLFLAVKSNPPLMVGPVTLKAKIQIPEGEPDLLERLRIQGQFDVTHAHFTSESVQSRVDSLSRRGQGHPKDLDDVNAPVQLNGAFTMKSGTVSFSQLHFNVTGASVALAGNYQVDGGQMDFTGRLKLTAKLSQTVTGVKSFFLKAADPFFKGKDAGTDLPIKITGTKDHPVFGLDFHDKSNKKD